MQVQSNTDRSSLEVLILACSGSVQSMARGFARSSSRVDADDMYSIGMLEVCEAAARAGGAHDPIAYLCKAAHYAMLDEWRRVHGWSTQSLDVPLSNDNSLTLYDILPAPAAVPAPASSRRSRALNGAMRRLGSSRQRAVLRRRHGLPGYGASTLKQTASSLHTTVAAVDGAGRRGLRNLATDARLCKVVGVQA